MKAVRLKTGKCSRGKVQRRSSFVKTRSHLVDLDGRNLVPFVNERDRSMAVELALLSSRTASPYGRGYKNFRVLRGEALDGC